MSTFPLSNKQQSDDIASFDASLAGTDDAAMNHGWAELKTYNLRVLGAIAEKTPHEAYGCDLHINLLRIKSTFDFE